ncbi:MAG: A/G-specific adenine glycosylase [Pseudomonadota bacterium]
MDAFAAQLLDWFDDHGRHNLPWQQDGSAYHTWLSEIMLQQTQVATVIPYYQRFTSAFPDIQSLATADIDDVLHHWSGLGYYARARNLHKAAIQVVEQYNGEFPADVDALQALPGVGRSTAGAILSSALGGRAPILDGNVKRVLARYHAVEGWPGQTRIAAKLWELAESHTPQERVASYTQAIMDLGATLCTRTKPACIVCPQAAGCEARRLGHQDQFPGRKPKKVKPTRHTVFAIACSPEKQLWFERRPNQGIWGGLWCFPEVASKAQAEHYCEEQLGAPVAASLALQPIRHTFSHYHLDIEPLLLNLARAPGAVRERDDLKAWPAHTPPKVGIAAPVKKIWEEAARVLAA